MGMRCGEGDFPKSAAVPATVSGERDARVFSLGGEDSHWAFGPGKARIKP